MEEQTFWQEHGDVISAGIILVLAVLIALVVDRFVMRHAERVASRVPGVAEVGISRVATTRLRLVRRLVFVTILVIGAALALSEFTKIEKLATGILASSAVIGLVVGFAARQTIGNLVAGISIAVTQPIRIGDTVTVEDETGRVDDITLTFTYLDPGDGRLMVVPNEKVMAGVVYNHSTGDRTAPATVSVWVPPAANLEQARSVLLSAGAAEVAVVEITPDGVRLELKGPHDRERTQVGDEEAELRERAHEALREAGLLAE